MTRSRDEGRETLDRAWEGLEEETPDRVSRMIRWLREPRARWIRLPIGLPPIAQSFMFFLPFAGIEFLPLGLLLVAQDVPFLRKPVGRFTLWLEARWRDLRRWWRRRRTSGR